MLAQGRATSLVSCSGKSAAHWLIVATDGSASLLNQSGAPIKSVGGAAGGAAGGTPYNIRAAAGSPDGQMIACACADGSVVVFDATGQSLQPLTSIPVPDTVSEFLQTQVIPFHVI